jgi:hypothetical protein
MDFLEGELMSELENARLVRLLTKFGFINERPEYVQYHLRLSLCFKKVFLAGLHAIRAGARRAIDTSSSSSVTTFSIKSTSAGVLF